MALALVLIASLTGRGTSASEPHRSIAPRPQGVHSTPATSEAFASSSPILPERRWIVEQFGDETAPRIDPPAVTVAFWSNGRLGGTSVCNSIGGAATWNADGTFSNLTAPLISTLMACGAESEGGKQFADRFWRKMETAQHWESTGELITIRFADGSTAELREIHP